MLVKFIDRLPGNHVQIAEIEMDAVPRVDEGINLQGRSGTIHEVTWDIDAQVVHVLVRF